MIRSAALIFVLATVSVASANTVAPPIQRTAALEQAAGVLAHRSVQPQVAMTRDPFLPPPELVAAQSVTSGEEPVTLARRTDRQTLAAASALVNPTGVAERNGVRFLLFGDRRLREGDHLTVKLEGSDALVQIVGISADSFTLRVGEEEITRKVN
jgi:hypothetical protein